MSTPWGPAQFVKYFEQVNREFPSEHWANGIEAAKRWLALATQDEVTQLEVDEFLARLRAEPTSGSGWWDMARQFKYWAKQGGFRV